MQASLVEINSLEDSPITAAFGVAANTDYSLLVGLYDQTDQLLSFSETEIYAGDIPRTKIESAQDSAVEVGTKNRYLIRSIDLGNGSFVVLASNLQQIQSSKESLMKQMFFGVLVILALGVLLTLAVMRKDLNAIKNLNIEADQIASGVHLELTQIEGKSEVANLSRSLASMSKSLQQQSVEMQRLLGDISHELKTPLTSIKGYADLLSQNLGKTEADLRAFEILQSEIDHMTRLINDILLMSKLGSIKYELNDEVDLGQIVNSRFAILQELQPDREIHLVDECPEKIRVSSQLITRLLDNLVSNAIAHTLPTDSVSVFTYFEDGSWNLQYEDSGAGLPESYTVNESQDFERFDERKADGKGSGLGLSIVKQIVNQHGGSLIFGQSYMGGLLLRITVPMKIQ
jgi:signal transduction histidine kinase